MSETWSERFDREMREMREESDKRQKEWEAEIASWDRVDRERADMTLAILAPVLIAATALFVFGLFWLVYAEWGAIGPVAVIVIGGAWALASAFFYRRFSAE